MILSRRNLLELSIGGAAAMVAGRQPAIAARRSLDEIRESAVAFFQGRGHLPVPSLPMITGDDFNGGLRFDAFRREAPPEPWAAIQTAARIDDIAERDRPGVLAGFTVVNVGFPMTADSGATLDVALDFLVEERGLNPERMVFVSTAVSKPMIERFEPLRAGTFIERDIDEAKAAGDGSGYFAPPGHPYGPTLYTVGIYYPFGDAVAAASTYPLDGYIEIAEITVPPADAPRRRQGGSIGLERLAMAEGKPVPDYDESRLDLLRMIEEEAEREGKPLPPGVTAFASL